MKSNLKLYFEPVFLASKNEAILQKLDSKLDSTSKKFKNKNG
ncbi:MAG: hypothetical protein RL308_3534 [Bacteroidota bacterium]|jgi:hypothetical protein